MVQEAAKIKTEEVTSLSEAAVRRRHIYLLQAEAQQVAHEADIAGGEGVDTRAEHKIQHAKEKREEMKSAADEALDNAAEAAEEEVVDVTSTSNIPASPMSITFGLQDPEEQAELKDEGKTAGASDVITAHAYPCRRERSAESAQR
eukprot:GHVS01086414.1.p1 GENE.GHVS01086414.1~~GHVS01086414.1.p1  ORF type:complete len:146 (+),score=33.21 GHVS01086414.1:160-597(+)